MEVDVQLMTRAEGVGITGHRDRYLTELEMETSLDDGIAYIERAGLLRFAGRQTL